MKKIVRKIAGVVLAGVFAVATVAAGPAEQVQQLTLENGMTVFLLENPADAVVNIEFECKAGFSSQTQNSNGFFKLFTRVLAASTPELHFSAVCNADSSRYSLTTSPALLEKTLHSMAESFFNPNIPDEVLAAELTALKREVAENADSMSYYINAAIDSRVFSASPWKHDSGIYPPLFNKTSQKLARTTLTQIAKRWYVPQNCALFINGNINPERLEIILKNSFGRFYSATEVPQQKPNLALNVRKNFVFHSKEISPDLTQLVIQYTMLSADECDVLATMMNWDGSDFKARLVENPRLNIPGDEYINVSAVHEKDSSRLIIQTLLQKPEDKKVKVSSCEQAADFMEALLQVGSSTDGAGLVGDADLLRAKKILMQEMETALSNPREFMTKLADFWAQEDYRPMSEETGAGVGEWLADGGSEGDTDRAAGLSPTVALMLQREKRIENITLQQCFAAMKAEVPFVFIIINSEDFKNTKKAYAAEGFEEINESNSSWYVQKLFKELRNQTATEDLPSYITNRSDLQDNNFAEANLSQITKRELSNGILVISKMNKISTRTTMLLSVRGGKFNTAENHGFEEVMIQLLAGMIQRELGAKLGAGLITVMPEVRSHTDLATSSITIEFAPEDSGAVCAAIVNAIIYGEIPPAMADRAVASRQYKKRLENGSAVNQIFYGAVQELYKGSAITKVFETENDVLQTTNYSSILSEYPQFLDARRYSIILTGKIEEGIYDEIEASFGQLSRSGKGLQPIKANAVLQKGRTKTVGVVHTFLTDIPAEEAGPMPAELIPTTEFLDPVVYVYGAPDGTGASGGSVQGGARAAGAAEVRDAALYAAILNYIEEYLQKRCAENPRLREVEVSVILPRNSMPFGTIVLQNVRHTKEADSALRGAFADLKKQLSAPASAAATLLRIKDAWNLKQMNRTGSDAGTAALLQKGLELSPDSPRPELYLEEYNYIQGADNRAYLEALNAFSDKPNLSVYSKDGKK